jgi:hypothetical protein
MFTNDSRAGSAYRKPSDSWRACATVNDSVLQTEPKKLRELLQTTQVT